MNRQAGIQCSSFSGLVRLPFLICLCCVDDLALILQAEREAEMNCTRWMAPAAVLLICLSELVFAQGGATGAINGTVQDASGAVLAGARVDVVNESIGQIVRQLTTDPSGVFAVPFLPVGTYSIEISAVGFARTRFPGIVVRITETTRMTAALKPSAAQEVVEVQGEVAPVNTTAATTGVSLGYNTINSLPLATRNFQQILTFRGSCVRSEQRRAAWPWPGVHSRQRWTRRQ